MNVARQTADRSVRIDVVEVPHPASPESLRDATVIIVDVLRASSTVVAALKSGATSIRLALTIEEACGYRSADPQALLCGERNGVMPAGFDLGNSPGLYTIDRVGGRRLIMTTSNGTAAARMYCGARTLLWGALTNARAIACYAIARSDHVIIVCAGTDGAVSEDDIIAAGAIAAAAMAVDNVTVDVGGISAIRARTSFERASADLSRALAATKHGQFLMKLGHADDIREAAQLNAVTDIVPLVRNGTTINAAETQVPLNSASRTHG